MKNQYTPYPHKELVSLYNTFKTHHKKYGLTKTDYKMMTQMERELKRRKLKKKEAFGGVF